MADCFFKIHWPDGSELHAEARDVPDSVTECRITWSGDSSRICKPLPEKLTVPQLRVCLETWASESGDQFQEDFQGPKWPDM